MRFGFKAVETREGNTRHNRSVSRQRFGGVGKYVRG